ncbi:MULTISPECIES: iron-sulfur cluster insertion protein ErpA [Modicisalibacter]|uniref:Iron-sulfur cluster insertion protein ErpA n=1 Tax=Modicisalibacter tunisiensis TaxID=390637 RepID=A0ABS7WYS9_9GAMM|nr:MULTISPECIES: iron-sulfur cluster insertion protein ErpA [Modicisalibacter]KXS38234.1 MAG: iron-sulfur cluster insertion protein [Halomonadaceae bacterium T82-2]MBZ9539710.1 iron-sulfur cluster insertion protein ErpA [Modicisalibacter tunisiensis]MBZ9566902.1 iron-sulfur cluster insertion protein ErpA [Modicisalibacter tunisiensis]
MSGAATFAPTPLLLTEAAARRIQALAADEGNPQLKLRVYVTGGGCSGFQYGFDVAQEAAEDDTLIEVDGVGMLVDPLSYQYLVGSTVDFEEGLAGARFVIRNPNATSTCGCGASFMV